MQMVRFLIWSAVMAFSAAAVAQSDAAASAPESCSGFFCQMGKAISDGVKQGTGGKSFGEAITSGVQDGLAGKTPQVLGHVLMGNGGYLTFFDNNPGGFPSRGQPLSVPPRPGTIPPGMVLVPINIKGGKSTEGALLANNIEVMKKEGVFIPVAAPATAAPHTAAAGEKARSVPRVLSLHNGVKFQTSPTSCGIHEELGPDDRPTGRQLYPTGALIDATARCETRLSEFRRAQMDALEQADAKKK